jgi:hypothetical protein
MEAMTRRTFAAEYHIRKVVVVVSESCTGVQFGDERLQGSHDKICLQWSVVLGSYTPRGKRGQVKVWNATEVCKFILARMLY